MSSVHQEPEMTTQIPGRTSDGRFQSAANRTEAEEAQTPWQPTSNHGRNKEDTAAGLPAQETWEPTARKSPIQWPRKAAEAEEKHKGYLGELEDLQGKVELTARELFGGTGLEAREKEEQQDDGLKEKMSMEEMLWEIEGEEMGEVAELSALEKLFSVLVVKEVQVDLPDRMNRKYGKPYGTLDALLADVEEMYKEEVKSFKVATTKGGGGLRDAVKKMVKDLSTGVGIISVLINICTDTTVVDEGREVCACSACAGYHSVHV